MELKVIGTGSKGNAYLLENEQEALLIECGVNIKEIKAALNFNLKKLVGCIVTHEHNDHAKSINDLMSLGINVFATSGTFRKTGFSVKSHRQNEVKCLENFVIGGFKVLPFDVKHDAAEPCGFLINHKESGNVLFLTDTIYSSYTFDNLHNIIIEANYDHDIASKKLGDKEFLRNRIINNHMSLDTCSKLLKANDLSKVNNIVLIHLSDSNSDAVYFQEFIKKQTGKNVSIADNGLVLNFNKTPF